jgi:hypothetical protein
LWLTSRSIGAETASFAKGLAAPDAAGTPCQAMGPRELGLIACTGKLTG